MLYMIVDAIDARGSVSASYPITLKDVEGQSVTDEDFIELAQQNHEEGGREFASVTQWLVREPTEQAAPDNNTQPSDSGDNP